MKKFLALVLALVMTMSLVTVSASAKTDFTDDAKITNEEAVEVLNAIGVLTGYADGSFRPQATLTRGAGAKIIAYLMLGQAKADKLAATYTVFKDVDDTVGLAAYIEWAAANGIVDGYGDGNFGPYNTLTEYAFGKMLLTALGYSSEKEGFTGAGWQKNVYRIATSVGVFDGSEAFGACDRETAARMALGALTAYTVEYGYATAWDAAKKLVFTTNGAHTGGKQLYMNYPGLGYNTNADIWGRPGHTWTYKTWSKFYMDEAVKTYYVAVDDCTLLVDLGIPVSSSKAAALSEVWYNAYKNPYYSGIELKHQDAYRTCNDKFFGGQGVLTQVFADPANNGKYIVTEIATYLAQVTDVSTWHAGKLANLDVFYRNLDEFGRTAQQKLSSVKTATVSTSLTTNAYAENDIVAVTWNSVKNEIVDHTLATGVAGKLTGYTLADLAYPQASKTNVDASVQSDAYGFVNGYEASKLDANLGTTYAFYYDAYGNVIGMFKIADAAASWGVMDKVWSDHAAGVLTVGSDFVTMDATVNNAVDVTYWNGNKVATMTTAPVAAIAANNASICKTLVNYSVNNGSYSIAQPAQGVVKSFNDYDRTKVNHILVDKEVYMDNETQILVLDAAGKYTGYVGYANLPVLKAETVEYVLAEGSNVAEVVFMKGVTFAGSSVKGYLTRAESKGAIEYNAIKYNVYEVYVDGVATSAYVKQGSSLDAALTNVGLYEITFESADGLIVMKTVKKVDTTAGTVGWVDNGLVNFGGTWNYMLDGVAVYVINDYGMLTVGTADDLVAGRAVDIVWDVNNVGSVITAIYVQD